MRRSGMLIALAIAFVGWLFIPRGCFQCPFYNGTTLTRALIREAGKEKFSGEIDIEKFFGGEIYVLASFAADAWGQRLFPGQPAIYSEASSESDGIWYVLMSNQKDGYYIYRILERGLCWDPEHHGQRCGNEKTTLDGLNSRPQKPKKLDIRPTRMVLKP